MTTNRFQALIGEKLTKILRIGLPKTDKLTLKLELLENSKIYYVKNYLVVFFERISLYQGFLEYYKKKICLWNLI